MPERTIKSVFEEHKKGLLAITGVVGVATGKSDENDCIRVFVAWKDSKLIKQFPQHLEGYEVIVEKTGEMQALDTERY